MGMTVAVLALNALDLTINRVYFCTDSTTDLKWISSVADHHKNFISSRIEKIHKVEQYFHKVNWGYCPRKLNPTDIAFHELIITHKNLEKLESWLNELPFLDTPDQWPQILILIIF